MLPPQNARDRALYRAALEAQRIERAKALDEKRDAGTIKSASANRKRRKHGRTR